MFEYIRGILEEKSPGSAVVDVQGVGYFMDIAGSTFDQLPRTGAEVRLFAHHHVREDAQRLYGFYTRAEREMFRRLISISKVGPKVALSVLSHLSVSDIARAVATQDSSRLKGVPGIGPTTARRLVMELKGKLGDVEDTGDVLRPPEAGGAGDMLSVNREAAGALASLGYSEAQVQRALARVEQVLAPDAPVEEWIKKTLQVM